MLVIVTGPCTHQSPFTNRPAGYALLKVQVIPYWEIWLTRFTGLTVKVAWMEVTLPATLLTTTVNLLPFFDIVVAGVVKLAEVAPEIAVLFSLHW